MFYINLNLIIRQEQFFCINSFCSLPETGGLKIDFEIEISILCF